MVVQGESGEGWTLENTPTWAVATVCTVFVASGLLIVFAIEKIEHRLKEAHRKPLAHALQKMKEELMLLGFISLLLTAFQNYVSSICVKTDVLQDWSPCRVTKFKEEADSALEEAKTVANEGRRLLTQFDSWPMIEWGDEPLFHGRILSQSVASACKPGHAPFVSTETLHQLHTLIFVLAIVHIIYSLFAMLLASTKVNGWRVWEEEAHHKDAHDNMSEVVRSMSLHRQTTFIKYHTSKPWKRNKLVVWIICFFRQFGKSVVRSDYLALRLGFITTHNMGHKFDFHSYVIRSLEDEYQKVVGISASLWFLVVLFVLFNVVRTHLFFWLSFIPAVVVLLVGAKLQRVIATLALESAGFSGGGAYAGAILKPRDELFWFNRPQLILTLIHFIFFQNAFEMATFLSVVWQFGFHSCLLNNKALVFSRISIGVITQIMCSYRTLPLYALVTQMGSQYKQAIFQEHVKDKIHHWRKGAKKRLRHSITLAEESQDDSTAGLKRLSTDFDVADETCFKTRNEGGTDSRFELGSPGPKEQCGLPPPDHHFSTLEISIGSDLNDGQPLLIPISPKLPIYGRAMSVPKATTQPIYSKKLYKQLSSGPEPVGISSVKFQPDVA